MYLSLRWARGGCCQNTCRKTWPTKFLAKTKTHSGAASCKLDVELPPLLTQVYSNASARVCNSTGPHEAKDQVGCSCSKLRGSCSREMAKTRPLKPENQHTTSPQLTSEDICWQNAWKNLCKTVEISCTWFTVLVQGKLMQVAQTSHGPHYATSPQELALPLSGTAPKLSYTTNTARPKT